MCRPRAAALAHAPPASDDLTLSHVRTSAPALVIGAFALAESITCRMVAGAALVAAAVVLNAIAGNRAPAGTPVLTPSAGE